MPRASSHVHSNMVDTAPKPQQGALTAFFRKLLHWGSDTPTISKPNCHESSTNSKGAESVYSSYDPSTDVSSLAPSGMSMGHSSHGAHNSLFIGNNVASPLATPPPAPTSGDQGLGPAATTTTNAPSTTNMVVSVIEPIHNHSSNSRTPSCRAADTASVLTIASSSKRRRRRSIDTNASTRALFAESIFSGTDAE